MPWTVDQSSIGTAGTGADNGGATTIVLTTSAAAATGALVVVATTWYQASRTPTISGGGLSWSNAIVFQDATVDTGAPGVAISYAPAPSGLASSTALTVTWNGSTGYRRASAASFMPPNDPAVESTSTHPQSGSVAAWNTTASTNTPGALVVVVGYNNLDAASAVDANSTESADTGTGTGIGHVLQYRLATTSGSYPSGGTWSTAAPNLSAAVVFAGGDSAIRPDYRRFPKPKLRRSV